MPPKNDKADKADKTFSFNVVACLFAALDESGVTIGQKHFKMMAAIDSTRSQSGYEHLFRDVKKEGKMIHAKVANGEIKLDGDGTPNKKAQAATPKSGKKGKKNKKVDEDDEEAIDGESPSKKIKAEEDGAEGFFADSIQGAADGYLV